MGGLNGSNSERLSAFIDAQSLLFRATLEVANEAATDQAEAPRAELRPVE